MQTSPNINVRTTAERFTARQTVHRELSRERRESARVRQTERTLARVAKVAERYIPGTAVAI